MRFIVSAILLFVSVGLVTADDRLDPIADRMRYEITGAQRDYLLQKAQKDTIA